MAPFPIADAGDQPSQAPRCSSGTNGVGGSGRAHGQHHLQGQSQDHKEWEGKITNGTKDGKKIFHQHWLSPLVHVFFTNTSALVTSVINLFREVKLLKMRELSLVHRLS